MKMKKAVLFTFIVFSLALLSCKGDCKNEEIDKFTWDEYNVEYKQDTLVEYTIIESRREYVKVYNQIQHTIIIKNENEVYPNTFAISTEYGYYDDIYHSTEMRIDTTEFVEVAPKSEHTFIFYSQAGYNYNFNNSYNVIQYPKAIVSHIRKDTLYHETYTANSCKENIEALKEKYYQTRELYNNRKPH